MTLSIVFTCAQFLVLLLLLARDKNDGEKSIFRQQGWRSSDLLVVVLVTNGLMFLAGFMASTDALREIVRRNTSMNVR